MRELRIGDTEASRAGNERPLLTHRGYCLIFMHECKVSGYAAVFCAMLHCKICLAMRENLANHLSSKHPVFSLATVPPCVLSRKIEALGGAIIARRG
jgi:hypothetical protein